MVKITWGRVLEPSVCESVILTMPLVQQICEVCNIFHTSSFLQSDGSL